LIMEAIDSNALSYNDTVTASAHAASMGGSQIWLKEGETMTVEDLLKAICVVSGNDASVAMAEHLAGTEEQFVERMNARAKELGMNDTHFVNCTGLPAEGHVTSAYDIALMSRELILNHPDIRRFTTIWMDTLRNGESSLVNTNKLIRFYDGATGLKTGSTDAARYCLSATAERDGMELIAAVLKGPTSQQRFDDARAMLDHGFALYSLVPIHTDEALPPLDVTLGCKETVQPLLSGANTLLLEKEKCAGLTTALTLPENVKAPVNKGDTLGELTVESGGEIVARIPVIAGETVEKVTLGALFAAILRGGF
ncbi:MAG: D-alanyl-D-alanine carboxypeptidase, partial [Oscillospiraceae bacterium]|nr:D-alanyl-D-alanine carboxypeptidase [Oscillospiraceae bacterium]